MSALPIEQSSGYFETLEKAVRETARGQAFLEEFARRLRSSETQKILGAIEQLGDVVREKTNPTNHIDVLRRELETMAASIQQTRKEIASIKPEGPGNNRIVKATEELDHVVKSTERATADILTSAERIQAIAGELKPSSTNHALCDELESQAMNLMLACSFQDLTGQRMTKVVNTLRYLEQRVNAMIEIWGITAEDADKAIARHMDARADSHLLNGPALDGEGVDQDVIDRMMNDPNSHTETAETQASAPAPAPATPVAKVAAAPEPSLPAGGPASQDDIDALFK